MLGLELFHKQSAPHENMATNNDLFSPLNTFVTNRPYQAQNSFGFVCVMKALLGHFSEHVQDLLF